MSHHSAEEPWIDVEAGDLIRADDIDNIQRYARADIKQSAADLEGKIGEVEEKLSDVDAAKFGGKTPDEWSEQFAPSIHDHEETAMYRRYIKQFTEEVDKVFLKHQLGRYPLVDVYELRPVTTRTGYEDCKLLFYYGKEDADEFGFWVRVFRDRIPLGLSFEQVLAEVGVVYEDDDTIEDVLNDLWTAFMKDPNDVIKHCTTDWIDECCAKRRTVKDLKDTDQWADLYLAIKPRKCGKGADLFVDEGGEVIGRACQAEVTQVNYDTLLIEASGFEPDKPLDLMFLLRS